MHILQVNTSDAGGGAEGSAWNLFQAYRSRGHESWLAVGYKRGTNPNVIEISRDQGRSQWAQWLYWIPRQMQVRRLKGAGKVRQVLMPFAEPYRFLERLRGHEDFNYPGTWDLLNLAPEKPDIIHLHNLHGGYFDLRSLPWLSQQVPVILNMRDAWPLTGHCAHFLDCQRWQEGCGDCPYLNIYPALWQDGTAYNWRRKRDIYAQSRLYVTAPSQWLIEQAQQSMLEAIEYRVIPNGIDLDVFSPGDKGDARRQLGLPVNSKIVLFAAQHARNNPYKDFTTIERAMSIIGSDRQSDRVLFVCLGSKGQERQLGNVRAQFVGFESDPERVAQYYRAADLFVHAARAEAFGKTVVEAQACGTPVVATAVGGIPELIEDGVTGFLTPIENPSAMATRVMHVLNNEELRRRMSAKAAKSVSQFSLQRQVDAFLDWYRQLASRSSATTSV